MGQDAGGFDWQPIRSTYLAGEYARCRELLAQAPEPAAQLWLARIESREGRYGDALARLLASRTPDPELSAERDVRLAGAYANTGEFRLAHHLLDRAMRAIEPPAEIYYQAVRTRSLACYLAGDYDGSATAVRTLLESPNHTDRAQGYAHRSWIAASAENLRGQLSDLLDSVEEHLRADELDQYAFGNALMALAALCRELPTHGVVERVREASGSLRASEATASARFQLLRTLGWIEALGGDEVSAMHRFRQAERDAPSKYWRVFSLADRAYLARAMRREAVARDALREANEQASQLNWENTRGEERLILLTIALLSAPHNPAVAQRYLATFRSLRTPMRSRIGWVGDSRVRAFQNYAHGVALLHLGEPEAAIAMIEESQNIFSRLGYGWRAALAALDLYQATGERAWLTRAEEQIAPWPRSWIAGDIHAAR